MRSSRLNEEIFKIREKTFALKQKTKVEHITDVINGISTQLFKIQSNLTQKTIKGKRLIYIMIPGNPGISSCYIHWFQIFISMFIDDNSNKYDSVCVYVMSHANHAYDKNNYNKSKIYLLNDQIQHKLDCIKYIISAENKHCEYIIGGHSIGSFMALSILKYFDDSQFIQIHLWCPTIVNIAKSNNGKRTNFLMEYVGLLYLLPMIQFIVTHLIPKWFIKFIALNDELYNKDKCLQDIICNNACVISNILKMAKNEFDTLLDLNETGMDKALEKYKEKLVFYWAETDGWAHQQCRIDIKNLFGKKYDTEMRNIFFEWIVDDNLKHAIMIDDLSKNTEEKLSKKMISWIAALN